MIASMISSLDNEGLLTWGVPDHLGTLRPASEADYRTIEQEIQRQRAAWAAYLRSARREVKLLLEEAGLRELRGAERLASVNGEPLPPQSYLLLSRLKSSEAIRRKMARFGEELCCMLDIWGIRLVQAVHINRRAPFGVVEIQVMTHDLFLRAFQAQGLEESHRRFAQRRTQGLRNPD